MGLMDGLTDKAKDAMQDPKMQEKIKEIAQKKGLTLDEAKDHVMKNEQSDNE